MQNILFGNSDNLWVTFLGQWLIEVKLSQVWLYTGLGHTKCGNRPLTISNSKDRTYSVWMGTSSYAENSVLSSYNTERWNRDLTMLIHIPTGIWTSWPQKVNGKGKCHFAHLIPCTWSKYQAHKGPVIVKKSMDNDYNLKTWIKTRLHRGTKLNTIAPNKQENQS